MEEGGGFITEELERVIQKQQPQEGAEQHSLAFYSKRPTIHEPRQPGDPSGCHGCSSLSYSQDLYAAFGVYLCQECRKKEKLLSKVRNMSNVFVWMPFNGSEDIHFCSHLPSSSIC